ncbi:MAG: DNA mismatch repair endonuclease MutL [Firmicutes bacterium]|nr:DNA mismatch repair endonuclease MutL [Bacillota bacterium]
MKKINILPPSIFNLLAAGEVVENPACIIKECVENSLDAGATDITVEIKNSGLAEIKITDNGHGVPYSEIEKVFMPHATSKISTEADIDAIRTMGFRGEALSSIARVAKVKFITKTKNDDVANAIEINGGEVVGKSKQNTQTGSTIIVRNLFFNTPARKKFLSSDAIEKNKITGVIQKIILSNPGISFRYLIDSAEFYNYPGGTLLDALALIYGTDLIKNVLEVNGKSSLGVVLQGYIGTPVLAKRNRTYQTVMVNNRPIEGGIIATAVSDAFSSYITTGNHPFFALNITIDPIFIDVNVHPRKTQIKFENEEEIHDFVKSTVIATLDSFLHKDNIFTEPEVKNVVESKEISKDQVDIAIKYFADDAQTQTYKIQSAPNIMKIIAKDMKNKEVEDQPKKGKPKQTETKETEHEYVTVGTIFDTYILQTDNEKFYIIDQHALHERLLYDELKEQISSGNILAQPFLTPYLLFLTPDEVNQLLSIIPHLKKSGIDAEIFGNNCLRIHSVPLIIPSTDSLSDMIYHLLDETKSKKSNLVDILDDKIIAIACKTAIKAGRSLTPDQIGTFLQNFKNKKIIPTCPHGRPVIIKYTRTEIEKLFMRK